MPTLRRSTLFLLTAVTLFGADQPLKEISMASVAEVVAGFRTPPPETGMVLWWGWDGPVDEAVIQRDLDTIKGLGFTSVMLEAGYNMKAEYLSPAWFELVRTAVLDARERGMRVWIEDEGKYPSGFAGGKFTRERPDLRMQALVAERIVAAPGETVARKLTPRTVGALAVNLAEGTARVLDVKSGELRWTAPEGKWQVQVITHDFRTSPTRAVSNPTRGKDTSNSLGDYMNPDATRQFIAWTHEGYKKYIGDEFGKTFLGFMGDEPDYSIQGLPWTPAFWAEFEKRKRYDVRPSIPLLFAPRLTEEARKVKADYWDVFAELMAENFFGVQADWCARNGVQYKVHLNHEHNLMNQVRSEGDFFRNMRRVQIPGIDSIWNQVWPGNVADFPKLASSAAHLFGRPRAFTESFAAYKTPPNVQQAKWCLDYQMARGINLVQIMFFPATSSGPRPPRGMMGDAAFPAMARYVTRTTYALSMGRPTAQIGVYMPASSMWMGNEASNKSVLAIAQKLLESQRDFDFVDEQALSSVLTLEKGVFRSLSGNEYRTILVPGAEAITKTSLDRLQAFAKSGGKVVFLGQTPSMVVATTFLKSQPPAGMSWATVEAAVELTAKVAAALPEPDVLLDQPAPGIKYAHRRWRDADMYFLFNESDQPVSRKARLEGSGQVQVWDAATAEISTLAGATAEKGAIRVPLELKPWEAKILVVGATAPRRP